MPESGPGAGRAALRRLEDCLAGWAQRRRPDRSPVRLGRRRIFILPTRYGAAFGCVLLAMLLGSMNYGASLGFALTFLLAGLGLVAMRHCRDQLLGIEIHLAGAAPVFAGERVAFRIGLANRSGVPRRDIELAVAGRVGPAALDPAGGSGPVDLDPGATVIVPLGTPTRDRGWVELPRLVVWTSYPGGLYRAWSWLHIEARCLVYPRPAPPGRPAPAGDGNGGRWRTTSDDDADFEGLRAAVPGDPPRRFAWKAYARTGELLLKQFASGEHGSALFDWHRLSGLDDEARLSQLARWCLEAAAQRCRFGVRLPGQLVPLGAGEAHLHRCLAALALFGRPANCGHAP